MIPYSDKQEAYFRASEYIRDLIRRDQECGAEIEAVRIALIEGENSGISKQRPGDMVRAAKKKLKADGRI